MCVCLLLSVFVSFLKGKNGIFKCHFTLSFVFFLGAIFVCINSVVLGLQQTRHFYFKFRFYCFLHLVCGGISPSYQLVFSCFILFYSYSFFQKASVLLSYFSVQSIFFSVIRLAKWYGRPLAVLH